METSDHVEPREPRDVQHTLTSSSAEISDHVVGTSLGSTWLLVSAEDDVSVCCTSRGFLSLTWSLVSAQVDVRFSSCRYSNPKKLPQIFELPVHSVVCLCRPCVCLCVFVTHISCAKTAEAIAMPFAA